MVVTKVDLIFCVCVGGGGGEWTDSPPVQELPGTRWLDALLDIDCEVHISSTTHILSNAEIIEAIGDKCDAVLGQLTEDWGEELFTALKAAGGKVRASQN